MSNEPYFRFPIKDSYGEDIRIWNDTYQKYRTKIKLKSLKDSDEKQLINKVYYHFNDDGSIRIGPRNKIFDLSLYYNDPDTYYFDLMNMIRSLRYDMQHKNGFYNFVYTTGEYSRMSCVHLLFNMICWYPLFIIGANISPNELFMPKDFTNSSFMDFMNNKIIEVYKPYLTFNEMSEMCSRVYDLFINISERVALYMGLSFSLYDIYTRWEHNKEMYDINHTVIPQDMSSADGEAMLEKRSKRFQEIIMNEEKDSQLKPLLVAGQANKKQLKEFAVNISYKPDLDGRTLNTHPKTNFISDGLRDPVDYVTDASGGRKAANLALEIDSSGYMQRTLCKSASDIYLNPDPNYDCGSKHYYVKTITTKGDLEDMVGRWYVKDGHLKELKSTDYDLIGETLNFRSPCTCASKHGICKYCYGYLYTQNIGINIGINSGLKLMERFNNIRPYVQ